MPITQEKLAQVRADAADITSALVEQFIYSDDRAERVLGRLLATGALTELLIWAQVESSRDDALTSDTLPPADWAAAMATLAAIAIWETLEFFLPVSIVRQATVEPATYTGDGLPPIVSIFAKRLRWMAKGREDASYTSDAKEANPTPTP